MMTAMVTISFVLFFIRLERVSTYFPKNMVRITGHGFISEVLLKVLK